MVRLAYFVRFSVAEITAKILKIGKIFSCFYFANSSPYCDMWLSCLSRAITPHPSRFSKSSWYKKSLNESFALPVRFPQK